MPNPVGRLTEYNNITDTIKAFGDAPATFEILVDLGIVIKYKHILLINACDKNITLRFKGDTEMIIQSSFFLALDQFIHSGVVEWKYSSDVPTTGVFQMLNW